MTPTTTSEVRTAPSAPQETAGTRPVTDYPGPRAEEACTSAARTGEAAGPRMYTEDR